MPPRYSKDSYEAQMTDYASTIEASWGGRASLDDAFLPGRSRIRRAPITWLPLRDIARLTVGESTNGLPPPRVCALIEEAANQRERETAAATAAVADARRPRGGRGPTIMAADLVIVRDQLRKAQGVWQRRVNKKRPRTKDDVSGGGGGGESSSGHDHRGPGSVGTGGSANWDDDSHDVDVDSGDHSRSRSNMHHVPHHGGYNGASRDYAASAYNILPPPASHPQPSYGFEYGQQQYGESSRTGMQGRGPEGVPMEGGPYGTAMVSREGDHYQGRPWQPQETFRAGPAGSRPRSYDGPLEREYGSGSNGDTPATSVSSASNAGLGMGPGDMLDKRLPPPMTGLLGSGMVAANDSSRTPARVLADLPRQLEYQQQSHHPSFSHYPQQQMPMQQSAQPYSTQQGYSMPPPGNGGYSSSWSQPPQSQQQIFDTSRSQASLQRRIPPLSDDRYSEYPSIGMSRPLPADGMESKHYSPQQQPQQHYGGPPQPHPSTLAGREARGPTAPRGVQLFSDSPGRMQQQGHEQHRPPPQQQLQPQQFQQQDPHNRLGNWTAAQQAQTMASMKQGSYPSGNGNGEEVDREGRGWGP